MNIHVPNILTSTRLMFAPVFFILVFLPDWIGASYGPVFILLSAIFLYIELTDIVDGYIARKHDLVSDLGKVLDPFSDVISRVSYFLAFVVLDIMPPVVFLLILYRELGIVFVRMMLAQRGISLAARKGGKAKSVLYFLASVLGLVMLGDVWFGWFEAVQVSVPAVGGFSRLVRVVTHSVFWLAALFAILSFVDYLLVFARHVRAGKGGEQ
ncbi:CDP-diacylglycerol--glycerol-3-phosphate 3-phosphatidyltransferase [Salinispira pacifica]|uniref:CDP-diacylglycerol--glycerol-3-phosphate 3-phosphatidyltransferase n=1 Tax=Salinispira pacifica TaxID=1307761 RepID=V5WDY2_9SPIO|nr:CDP-diacylglycerol--glycerol-3-phosphate 3-phosphatidyltransferase [Salinispira pacifica]AHC13779.1 CDP-diacylglycerol--glycerol-3-phosphate 3-phosphatidyltransferase [Salinispira pacifica]